MPIGAIKTLLTAGIKKPMAKRVAAKSTVLADEADEAASLAKEILSIERLLVKIKDEKVKESLTKQLMKLKHAARKDKPAPEVTKTKGKKQYAVADKLDAPAKPKAPAVPRGVGTDVAPVKKRGPMAVPNPDRKDLPAFLRPQGGAPDVEIDESSIPKMLKKQAS